jgi:hypothetical protein
MWLLGSPGKKTLVVLLYCRHFRRHNLRLGEARACTVASGERIGRAVRRTSWSWPATSQPQAWPAAQDRDSRGEAATSEFGPAGGLRHPSPGAPCLRTAQLQRAGRNSEHREFSLNPWFQLGTVNSVLFAINLETENSEFCMHRPVCLNFCFLHYWSTMHPFDSWTHAMVFTEFFSLL